MRVYFETDSYTVSETDGRVNICVRREGDLSGSVTIQVATEELTPTQAQCMFTSFIQVSQVMLCVPLLCSWARLH